jgi:hypothetical protein
LDIGRFDAGKKTSSLHSNAPDSRWSLEGSTGLKGLYRLEEIGLARLAAGCEANHERNH